MGQTTLREASEAQLRQCLTYYNRVRFTPEMQKERAAVVRELTRRKELRRARAHYTALARRAFEQEYAT